MAATTSDGIFLTPCVTANGSSHTVVGNVATVTITYVDMLSMIQEWADADAVITALQSLGTPED